jgi:polyphosphate:AMP phosphotransferase
MLETAEIGLKLEKDAYEAIVPELRTALLKAQTAVEAARFPVIVLLNGMNAAGKGEMLNVLYEWLDARYLTTFVEGPPTEEERERPPFWRYWMALPAAGRVGLFLGSWYTQPILDHARGKIDSGELAMDLQRISTFEKALTDDGALVVKFWLHLSKKEQRHRLEKLESNEETAWRVLPEDWKQQRHFNEIASSAERVLQQSSPGEAPWTVVEATDHRYRNVTVAQHLLHELERRLSVTHAEAPPRPEPAIKNPTTVLDTLDLGKKIERVEYEQKIPLYQAKLNSLARRLAKKRRSAIFLFEGSDAAGKGGAIRRVTHALDARQYRIIPISAPTEEERAHHYLWRFYRHLPRRGRITIYDRSWYGRVLVERVEGFATEAEWRRAYKEINDFEAALTGDGIVLVKFWLQISADEQLRRFEDREKEPWKQHKITAEDYRNREKTNQYEVAAAEMIARSSTDFAPFTLVEANDKRYARVKVLETICERLEQALD